MGVATRMSMRAAGRETVRYIIRYSFLRLTMFVCRA